MSERREKKKRKLNIKGIVAFVIITIFLICFFYNIIALFVNPTDTFMIENGKISKEEETVGYIVREETVFQGDNYKNGISQIKTEGQRVAKGDPIFRYYTNNEESLTEKINDLDVQIQDAMKQSGNIYSSDISSLNKEIEETLQNIDKINSIKDFNECKKEINAALTKKAKLTGELSPSGSYINQLISQRSKYEEELNSGSEYVQATISGMVSYKVDGLEGELTPDIIQSIKEEDLKNLKAKTGEIISTSTESGKIVNNYYSYLISVLNSDEARNAEVNDSVKLVLSTGKEVKAKIQRVSEEESGNILIVFKINEEVEQLIDYRKISFEIVWWSASGLKVPNSSIIEKDNLKYIVRKRVGYTDEIPVKVLKTVDNYSIIENYTSIELKELGYSTDEVKNMKSISLYDEILLKATN